MGTTPKESYQSEYDWVLCNLTKKEYVLKKTATKDGLSFGDFLVSRISWSSDSSMQIAYYGKEALHRGVWAGDRFEITTTDRMQGGIESWTDVGDAMAKVLDEIWDAQFRRDGSGDWKAFMRKEQEKSRRSELNR